MNYYIEYIFEVINITSENGIEILAFVLKSFEL